MESSKLIRLFAGSIHHVWFGDAVSWFAVVNLLLSSKN